MSQATAEVLIRHAGLAITVFGAVVVSPAGAHLLFAEVCAAVVSAVNALRDFLGRWLPFLRRGRSTTLSLPTVGTFEFAGTGEGHAPVGWGPDATADEKLEVLRGGINRTRDELAQARTEYRSQGKSLGKRIEILATRLDVEAGILRKALDDADEKYRRTDARALPVVGMGAIIAGIPGPLSRCPIWFWVLVLLVALGLSLLAYRGARADLLALRQPRASWNASPERS